MNNLSDKQIKEKLLMEKQFSSPPSKSFYDNYRLPYNWNIISGRVKGKTVLEIGCATGWITYHLLRLGANCLATDIFSTTVHPDIPFMTADKENLPFEDCTYDFVLTSNTLHHGNLTLTLQESYRVLKYGGEMVSFIEPSIPNAFDEQQYLNEYLQEELISGIDEHRPNLKTWRKELELFDTYKIYVASSLKEITSDDHYGGITIVATKPAKVGS